MPKKPTPADADLILKLYDLRREAEIRKARNWWLADFWPETADDFMKIAQALGTQENNWLRQVGGLLGTGRLPGATQDQRPQAPPW